MSGLGDTASSLLAQAVQQSTHEARRRKKRKKDRDKQDSLKQLVNLLQGKKNKKDKKEKRKKRRDPRGIKPDPDGSGGGDSSSSSGSSRSSRASQCDEAGSGEDSDLSLEAPLKRRATKEPASVLGMLVKHAQAQLDQGSFLETPDVRPSMTSGIKIATYFSLLIRPYQYGGSPLLERETSGDGRCPGFEVHRGSYRPLRGALEATWSCSRWSRCKVPQQQPCWKRTSTEEPS